MTLDSVLVDCAGAFQPGQVSFAIGKVWDKSHITVKNYRPGLCPAQPPAVAEYHGAPSAPFENNKSCCRQDILQPNHHSHDPTTHDEWHDTDSSSDEEDEQQVRGIPPTVYVEELPSTFSIEQFNSKLKFATPITQMHHNINTLLCEQAPEDFLLRCKFLYTGIHNISKNQNIQSLKAKHTNRIVHQYLHQFTSTPEFKQHLQAAFSTQQPWPNPICLLVLLQYSKWMTSTYQAWAVHQPIVPKHSVLPPWLMLSSQRSGMLVACV